MNWKRGLTRVYIVVWFLFALVWGSITWGEIQGAQSEQNALEAFVARHSGYITKQDMRTKTREQLSGALWAQYAKDRAGHVLMTPPDLMEDSYRVTALDRAISTAQFNTPSRKIMNALGGWAMLCIVLPALVLVVLAWIVRGFGK